jgi:hypothetical protein
MGYIMSYHCEMQLCRRRTIRELQTKIFPQANNLVLMLV